MILSLRSFSKFLLLIGLCFSCFFSAAQDYTANVKRFGVEHGLSHHDARQAVIDGRGLVWVGTRNGLNRFDGKKFKSFYVEDGLQSNNIELLFADGDVLICVHKSRTTEGIEGITLFHSVTERVLDFSDWIELPELKAESINAIYGSKEEIAFRAEVEGEIFWYLKKVGEPVVKFDFGVQVEFLASNQDGSYWFQEWENDQISRRDKKGNVLQSVSTKHLTTWRGEFYVDMRFAEHGKLVYAYDSLYVIAGNKLRWAGGDKWGFNQKIFDELQLPSEFTRWHPYSNKLWYSLRSSSSLIDSLGNTYYTYTNEEEYVNNVDLFEENIILQPTSSGLNIFSLYPSQFQSFSSGPLGGYRAIVKLGEDYVVCNYEGLKTWDRRAGSLKHLSDVGFCVITHNGKGYSAGRGVLHEIDEDHVITSYPLPEAHEVWSMKVVDSYLMYSTFGLHQYNLKTREDRFLPSEEYPEINEATIYSIQPRSEDEYWLCSTEGLFTWNKKTNAFNLVVHDIGGVSEFQHLYQDGDILWLASGGKGLVKHNLQTKANEYFDFANNQTNLTHAVYPDGKGNLWLSTDYGIVRFNRQSEQFRVFLQSDGLVNNEFNRISHFQEEDGTLFFGGVKGVQHFHPDSIKDHIAQNPSLTPFIADVWLYREGGNEVSQITNEFNEKGTVTIEPQDRFLSFDLATNSIEYYDIVEFSYRLSHTEEWKNLPSNRLEFNVLPFGKHEISVQARLPNGFISTEELKFEINVLKPWYLRNAFIVAFLLGLSVLFYTISVLRTRRLRKQKIVLEKEVRHRTQELKKDKETIEKQAEELKSLDKMKNRFFANISHELRNPLTLIVGPVENLLSQVDVKVPQMVRSQMELTLKNSRSLQKRVNEILSLSKIDSGKLKLSLSPIKIASYVGRLVAAHDSFTSSEALRLRFESKVPDTLVLEIDTDHTEKVLNNLLSNAIKHSPHNATVTVELWSMGNNTYSISVTDEGKGVALSEQEKVFDRYYQSKEGEKAGGTGLGLSLSNELAQLMGGSIRVDADYTSGARFIFSFKAATSEQEPIEFDAKEGIGAVLGTEVQHAALEVSRNEANVLVVDDNEEMRGYIKSILGPRCRIFEAENGLKALEVLDTRSVDLVTSDLMMPEMDGMELLEALKAKESTKTIPIIMLTARAEDADRLNALEIGVDDYITKPFYARELLARVNNLLEKRTQRAEAASEQVEESQEATEAELQIQKVVEVIQEHLSNNDFGVADLAEQIGYSERQLRRIIKKEQGLTPNALIKELRLNKARTYLERQKFATVSEVMFACGMKSSGHFTKSFFERFGKKPNEYFD